MTHLPALSLIASLHRPVPQTETRWVIETDRAHTARVFGEDGVPVLLFHGLSPRANEDPRMEHLAWALAQAGAQVICPRLPELAALRLDGDTRSLMRAWMRRLGPVHVVAVSFSGALALDACRGEDVRSVCTIGSPGDPMALAEYLLTDPQADPYGRTILLYNLLSNLGLDSNALAEALRLTVWDEAMGTEQLPAALAALPKAEAQAYRALVEDPEMGPSWWEGLQAAPPLWLQSSDPSAAVAELSCPVILLHGQEDRVIPARHSAALAQAQPRATLCITPALDHGDLQGIGPLQALDLHRTVRTLLSAWKAPFR